jgi:L-ribulose-5-phosphate 4-epimerase
MLDELKRQVFDANMALVRAGLVIFTWGNVSGIDRKSGCVVIKPSGVPYERMRPEDMVVVHADGTAAGGELKPSSDTPTHLELYRAWPEVGGVVHTHSRLATAWAQARRELPPLGTTHADYFHGPVPCTRLLTDAEVQADYEHNTGKVILERFKGLSPVHLPGVLVAGHGPFAWGASPAAAVENAIVMEHLAEMATATLRIDPHAGPLPQAMLDKHFLRKHGPGAYYGQK